MRIAVPLAGGAFNPHFGQSTAFWICDADESTLTVSGMRELAVPDGGGCGVIPALLARAGVNLVIAGGIGAGAVAKLGRCGIEALAGVVAGTPEQIVRDLLAGRLKPSGELCHEHDAAGHHQHRHGQEHTHGGEGCCHQHGSR